MTTERDGLNVNVSFDEEEVRRIVKETVKRTFLALMGEIRGDILNIVPYKLTYIDKAKVLEILDNYVDAVNGENE